jgi:3-oxoacyl-[acyl-carrier-protein] synthase II
MAAGSISIKYGFQGPLYAPATACAASLQSFDEAIKVLRNNEADVAIAGGSEAPIHPLIFAGFNEIGALSKQTSQPETASRPFDANRDGFVIGEGAAMFVIEKLSHALARGAKPLAEIISYGSSSDAWHVTSGSPDGNGVARAMTYALNEARISAEAIDLLSAHATSTPVGDRLEYKAIEHVFSTADTSITAIKGAFGHLQGAANALAVAMTIKSLEHQIVPQTLNTEVFNEEMQHLDIVTGGPREKNIEYAMINGFGFGGVNGAMILKRYRGLNANDVKNNVNELII